MPIVALEGPDRCGKGTMFEQLKQHVWGATFVPSLKYMEDLLANDVAPKVEARQAELWWHLFMPRTAYVVDRSFTLTPEVYSMYKARELLVNPVPWRNVQLIVYFDVPVDELRKRHANAPDKFDPADYERLVACYEAVLPRYRVLRVDSAWSAEKLGKAITKHFASCRLHAKV